MRKELLKDANPEDTPWVLLLFLLNAPNHLQISPMHTYVEVVLHGKTEGRFLEDPRAHRGETMGQISKLGVYRRRAAKRGTDRFRYKNFQYIGLIQT